MKTHLLLSAALIAVLSAAPSADRPNQPDGGKAQADKAEVLAGFVVNMLKFVTWPDSALPAGTALAICQLGDHAIESPLRRFDGTTVGSRPLRVRRIHDPLDARRCHAVFVGDTGSLDAAAALRAVRDVPTLTLSEEPSFIDRGGIVAFVTDGPKLRFAISQVNAERGALKISAQLLKLAHDHGAGGR